jgi:hypothetical protein
VRRSGRTTKRRISFGKEGIQRKEFATTPYTYREICSKTNNAIVIYRHLWRKELLRPGDIEGRNCPCSIAKIDQVWRNHVI